MEDPLLYIPVATTMMSLGFTWVVFQRYRKNLQSLHLLAWSIGILVFGVGTFTEGFTALFGWREGIFRGWYISGALMGGAPLAQGTVYLLFPRKTAHRMAAGLVTFIVVASILVLLSPVDGGKAEEHRLTADVLDWTWVRALSPFVNTYAAIFLIGGAVYSARRWRQKGGASNRVTGNLFIAVGAVLPGIGGSFTRMGYTEVLYVTEFFGVLLIYLGYRFSVKGRPGPVTRVRRTEAPSPAG